METQIHGVAEWWENSFKSYYVVWKPMLVNNWGGSEHSLNRTMQYGNYIAEARVGIEFPV